MLQIDTTGFDAFLNALEGMSGAPRRVVLGSQVSAVLNICIRRSPGPTSSGMPRAKFYAALRVMKPARYVDESGSKVPEGENVPRPMATPYLQTLTGTRSGILGNQWYLGRSRNGRLIKLPKWKIEGWEKGRRLQALQEGIEGKLQAKAEEAMAAVGSIRKSWIQIADALGLQITGNRHLRNVRTSYDDGARSSFYHVADQQWMELVNTNSALIKRYQGAAILYGAIQTRLKAFENDLRNDVFSDLKYRASRYKGIFVYP